MAKKKSISKTTARDLRKAEQLKTEVKAWAQVMRCSQKRIRAAIEAGTLVFRRGRLWISNTQNRRR